MTSKRELDKGDTIEHAKLDRPAFSPTKNYRQLRDAESRRNSLTQGRAHALGIQYQMVGPENVHTSNIIQTEQAIFRNMCIWKYI